MNKNTKSESVSASPQTKEGEEDVGLETPTILGEQDALRQAALTDTSCRICKSEMPPVKRGTGLSPIDMLPMKITGYRCEYCGHWNNLKLRGKKRTQ